MSNPMNSHHVPSIADDVTEKLSLIDLIFHIYHTYTDVLANQPIAPESRTHGISDSTRRKFILLPPIPCGGIPAPRFVGPMQEPQNAFSFSRSPVLYTQSTEPDRLRRLAMAERIPKFRHYHDTRIQIPCAFQIPTFKPTSKLLRKYHCCYIILTSSNEIPCFGLAPEIIFPTDYRTLPTKAI